jgi:preprotein translocase subunit SecF
MNVREEVVIEEEEEEVRGNVSVSPFMEYTIAVFISYILIIIYVIFRPFILTFYLNLLDTIGGM